jgi:hypothetical protein
MTLRHRLAQGSRDRGGFARAAPGRHALLAHTRLAL